MDGKIVSVNVKSGRAGRYGIREIKEMTEVMSRFFLERNGVLEINEEFDHSIRFIKSGNEITVQTFDAPLYALKS